MISINIDTSALLSGLARQRKTLRNLRPFFANEATDSIYAEVRKVFATQGYGRWAPLSPAYARRKARLRPGKTILRYDDNYFKAATSRNSRGSVYQVSDTGMTLGVNPTAFPGRYPLLHEIGTSRLPARSVFEIARSRLRKPLRRAFDDYFFHKAARQRR